MSERSTLIRELPCMACQIEVVAQPFPTECHHQNFAGLAGHKRLGDAFSVALCGYHHRGLLLIGWSNAEMEEAYGPSLARNPRQFRIAYGSDKLMLEKTNLLLETL